FGYAPVAAWPSTPPASFPEEAAGPPLVADTSIKIDFPTGFSIASSLAWAGDAGGVRLELLYTAGDSSTATIAFAQNRETGGPLQTRIETLVNLQNHFLPVGMELTLWWRLVNAEGMTIAQSDTIAAMWYDTARDWTEIASDQVILHSYALADDFAAETLSLLQETVDQLETRFDLAMDLPVRVWVYETYGDFQSALPPNSRESVAALAFTGYQTISAIVPDGNERALLRVLPHEISHQVLHQAAANAFSFVPVWFDEGMATHVQTGGTDGYMDMVVRAEDRGELFRLDSLNAGFPFSPAQATLAYATSWSAFAYIEGRWGDEGIGGFIDAIAAGLPFAEAVGAALGISANQLNDDWAAWVASQ
ncbi:MAG TPA: peptidase MA family metallohydrolase, partial [Thermomicrobiales bacterium]|nr:peptidase MA family metallohydrolase [Thermomicrobiales bacterium]